jgi:hypothetical protein
VTREFLFERISSKIGGDRRQDAAIRELRIGKGQGQNKASAAIRSFVSAGDRLELHRLDARLFMQPGAGVNILCFIVFTFVRV